VKGVPVPKQWNSVSRKFVVLALGVVAISGAAIFIRLAEAPALAIAAGRLVIASLVLLPCGLARSRGEMNSLIRTEWRLVLLAGGFLALHFGLWIASLSYTTVASSVVLVTASPLFVAVVSYVLFHERLRRATFLGIAGCALGALLIGYSGWSTGSEAFFGDILAFVAALAMAGYLLVGRSLRRQSGLIAYSTVVFSTAALFLLLAVCIMRVPLAGYSGMTYLMVLLLALVPQLLGHMSLNWALSFLPATMVTVAILGEPVGAMALARVVLGESPAIMEIVGSVLILCGIGFAFVRGGLASE